MIEISLASRKIPKVEKIEIGALAWTIMRELSQKELTVFEIKDILRNCEMILEESINNSSTTWVSDKTN